MQVGTLVTLTLTLLLTPDAQIKDLALQVKTPSPDPWPSATTLNVCRPGTGTPSGRPASGRPNSARPASSRRSPGQDQKLVQAGTSKLDEEQVRCQLRFRNARTHIIRV